MASDINDEIPALEIIEDYSVEDPTLLRLRVSSLQDFITQVVRNLSFKEFCRELMLIMMKAVPTEAASLLEVDAKREFMFFRVAAGKCSESVQSFQVAVNQGIAGKVYESKQHHVLNDLETSQIHLKTIEQAVGFQARNLLAIPILVRGEVFGVFEMINRIGAKDFSESDIEEVKYLSNWMAKVIEARLMINYQRNENERAAA